MKAAKKTNQKSRIKNSFSKLSAINHQLLAINKGFTLIEVLVAATILVTLAAGILVTLNPLGQINKAQDVQRISDVQAIKTALDLYYQDNKCYPSDSSSGKQGAGIPFGQKWTSVDGKTVYMKKVPQDPKCTGEQESQCYQYHTDASAVCPQWNVVFAQISKSSASTQTCPLSTLSNCTPKGYADASWACTLSGAVSCSSLLETSVSSGGVNASSGPTQAPTSTIAPTPIITRSGTNYDIVMPPGSNPSFYQASIAPLLGVVGNTQTLTVKADDLVSDIATVSAIIKTDNKIQYIKLDQVLGSSTDGTWSATWVVNDTAGSRSMVTFTGADKAGNNAAVDIAIR